MPYLTTPMAEFDDLPLPTPPLTRITAWGPANEAVPLAHGKTTTFLSWCEAEVLRFTASNRFACVRHHNSKPNHVALFVARTQAEKSKRANEKLTDPAANEKLTDGSANNP